MFVSPHNSIRLRSDSLLMKLYRVCDRFVNKEFAGSEEDEVDSCTLMRMFGLAFLKLVAYTWFWLGVIAWVLMVGLVFAAACWETGNVFQAVIITGQAFGAVLLGLAVVGVPLAILVWLVLSALGWCLDRRDARSYVSEHNRPASALRIAGQWLYDRAHGICRQIELV